MNPSSEVIAPEVSAEVIGLLARAQQLSRVAHTETVRATDTRRRLNEHGLSDEEIARQLSTLESNTAANETAVLTTYSYLHGLQHLDDIHARSTSPSHESAATLALFRAAEICLYTIGVLSERMLVNLQSGHVSEALSNSRWRAGFQQLLYKISLLVVETSAGPATGETLSIRDSRIYGDYHARGHRLQKWLKSDWPEDVQDVFGKDIDDPKRSVFFHEFVNVGDERVWSSLLARVQVPGIARDDGESDTAFYARVVCSDDVERMANAMETEAETDLLPFRVIHQITEVVASVVNARTCAATGALLTAPTADLDLAHRDLTLGNRLLSVVDDSIKLMMRTLTPKAYSAVRPNLGMVRGTSSMVLRKTLFNSSYPLLVRAFKLRMMSFDATRAGDDVAIHGQAVTVLSGDTPEQRTTARILQQIVVLHQHVRTWRDNHIQLPKTHLGVSPDPESPTVSLSGSDSAVDIAHGLRKTHLMDPIAPLYRALLGEAPPLVHEMLTPGGFDEHVAHTTARAVFDVYADVQERFERRCPVKHLPRGSE